MATTFRKSTLREYAESIVIAVILALFVRTWVVQAFKIPTGSMENNLLIGDHLLVNKFVYGPASSIERALLPIGTIVRGDVIVFKYPEQPDRDFIKRVIGLPGETLEVREKKVYINGSALDEPYAHYLSPASEGSAFHEVTSFDVRERYGPVTTTWPKRRSTARKSTNHWPSSSRTSGRSKRPRSTSSSLPCALSTPRSKRPSARRTC